MARAKKTVAPVSDSKNAPVPVATLRRSHAPRHVRLGDELSVERRYVVDGALTSVTDQGRFKGVQVLGSTEHLVIEDAAGVDVRMIPLHSISEIRIVAASKEPQREAFDPSFG